MVVTSTLFSTAADGMSAQMELAQSNSPPQLWKDHKVTKESRFHTLVSGYR